MSGGHVCPSAYSHDGVGLRAVIDDLSGSTVMSLCALDNKPRCVSSWLGRLSISGCLHFDLEPELRKYSNNSADAWVAFTGQGLI